MTRFQNVCYSFTDFLKNGRCLLFFRAWNLEVGFLKMIQTSSVSLPNLPKLTTLSRAEQRDLELVFAAFYFPVVMSCSLVLFFQRSNYELRIWCMKVQTTHEEKVTPNKDWKHTRFLFWEMTRQKTFTSSLLNANINFFPKRTLENRDIEDSCRIKQVFLPSLWWLFSPPCIPFTSTTHNSLWFHQLALRENTVHRTQTYHTL